jgi:hypothetical protein
VSIPPLAISQMLKEEHTAKSSFFSLKEEPLKSQMQKEDRAKCVVFFAKGRTAEILNAKGRFCYIFGAFAEKPSQTYVSSKPL